MEKYRLQDLISYIETISVPTGAESRTSNAQFRVASTDMKVFKKIFVDNSISRDVYTYGIVNLVIPKGTKFLCPLSEEDNDPVHFKCRAAKARVHSIYRYGHKTTEVDEGESMHSRFFVYKKGKTVRPSPGFDETTFGRCAAGIHFFFDLKSALNYKY